MDSGETGLKDTGRIQVLPPEEIRKIAAGEVIDRPAAMVRELFDNAVDAESSAIEILIEDGGIRRIEVIDDGKGMDRDDLSLCILPHATSKIRSLADLDTALTLGFRGEALAAAAAVSRMEILTSRDGREAWLLTAGAGSPVRIEQGRRARGTSVRAFGLFDAIPARKRFLKRDGAEGKLCRDVFLEKALAFPGLGLRFKADSKLKLFLQPVDTLKERFADVFLDHNEKNFLQEIAATGPGFTVSIVFGGPELYRNDRRQQFVFANKRRIQDYSLMQALEYGLQGWFPNGVHPVGAVFIEIDPKLADFNIHPAKKEARFSNLGAIHHAVSSALQDFSRRSVLVQERSGARQDGEGDWFSGGKEWSAREGRAPRQAPDRLALEALLDGKHDFVPLPGRQPGADGNLYGKGAAEVSDAAAGGAAAESVPVYGDRAVYLGTLFGVFILIEKGEALYVIDQHAAHERILYDRFLAGPIPRQELLVPILFKTESSEEDEFLHANRAVLEKLGIIIKGNNEGWRIEALPSGWRLSDSETVREILSLREAKENMAERWAATLSCRAAVKEGDYLDRESALALAEESFRLPIARCPHGRPIQVRISRDELYRAVRRTGN
ncbi:MAG: DNA mismatch repair endonuclease MutL [Treponema sp.]|jgi:DNA mismatch repair protein MutL|nr:DNA mismatch repair endonuclease MutL [Treponema sp.]